jgi:glycine/D-amino acid oxidase-like deaminating enzyme
LESHPTFYFLKERSVDPRALSTAAMKAAKHRGVDFSSGDPVTAVNQQDGRVVGVTTTKTTFHAPKVVNCAGAWSGQIAPHTFPTRPVKGQMLCLISPSRELLKHVIRSGGVYLIPRSDGRILVGATVEEAGFDKRTDVATIQRQHRAAIAVFPELRNAKILEDWAGLRPGTPDALPILGATSKEKILVTIFQHSPRQGFLHRRNFCFLLFVPLLTTTLRRRNREAGHRERQQAVRPWTLGAP